MIQQSLYNPYISAYRPTLPYQMTYVPTSQPYSQPWQNGYQNPKPLPSQTYPLNIPNIPTQAASVTAPLTGLTNVSGKKAYIALGLIGSAVAGALYLVFRKKPPAVEPKPVIDGTIQQVKGVFQVPPGLETPKQRRIIVSKLVDDCYDNILNVYKNRHSNSDWEKEVDRLYNQSLKKHVRSDLSVNFKIKPQQIGKPCGEYGGNYKKEGSESRLGTLTLYDDEQSAINENELKSTLRHETSHLLYHLAHNPTSPYSGNAYYLPHINVGLNFPTALQIRFMTSNSNERIDFLKKIIQNPSEFNLLDPKQPSELTLSTPKHIENAKALLRDFAINEYEARIAEIANANDAVNFSEINHSSFLVPHAKYFLEWANFIAQEIQKHDSSYTLPQFEKLSDVILINE